jgi:hypothetical protein
VPCKRCVFFMQYPKNPLLCKMFSHQTCHFASACVILKVTKGPATSPRFARRFFMLNICLEPRIAKPKEVCYVKG